MNLSSLRLYTVFLPSILLLSCSSSSDDSNADNDLSLFEADVQLELVQEWTLNDAEIFPNLTYFQATRDGELLVGDFSLAKFYHIDNAGNVINAFSGKGRGPGEMNSFIAMSTHPDGRVATADLSSGTVSIFSLDNDRIQTTDFESGWNTSLQWVDDKLIIVSNPFTLMGRGLPPGSLVISAFDPESEASEELFILELEMQDAPPEQISCTFCPVVFVDEHHFFTLNRDTSYRFHKFDVRTGEGETFEFSGMPPAVEYTESEINRIKENREESTRRSGVAISAPIPTHKFMFNSMFTDAENRIWLELNAHEDSSRRFDIFSDSGSYLGSVNFPENAERAEFMGEYGILFRFPSDDPEAYTIKLYSIEM